MVEESAGAIEDGGQAGSVCRGGGKPDQVNARCTKGGANFRIFFRRHVNADDAVHASFLALVREPFGPANQHGIGIAHEDEWRVRMAGAECGGEVEDVLGLRA